jgi:hypothetical protein
VEPVSAGLTVAWHDPMSPTAPPGWSGFVATQALHGVWDWSVVHACATSAPVATLAATVHDGSQPRALVTARFPGPRAGRRAVPLAGVVDVDCLASGSLPGIAPAGDADPQLRTEIVAALRDALRRRYGARVRALMFRQVTEEWLPSILRWPAVAREGGPLAVFRNRFTDFDRYLASLHRDRRWSLRRVLRELAADPELTVSFTARGDPPKPLAVPEVCALLARVVDRHHRRWWLRKRYLAPPLARAQLAHRQVHRLTYHDGARLLAYALVWDHPRQPLLGTWGALPPAESGRNGLWFHMNAVLLRWCIEARADGVLAGQGSIVDKRRLGYDVCRQWAVLVPQWHGRGRS